MSTYSAGGCALSTLIQYKNRTKSLAAFTNFSKTRTIVIESPGGGGTSANTRPLTGQLYPRGT
jgi:hypothetical protein